MVAANRVMVAGGRVVVVVASVVVGDSVVGIGADFVATVALALNTAPTDPASVAAGKTVPTAETSTAMRK
jgi:hypothetical protein